MRARVGDDPGCWRDLPAIAAPVPGGGHLQRHLPAANRQEGDVERAEGRKDPGRLDRRAGSQQSAAAHGALHHPGAWWRRQDAGQPRHGQRQRHPQVVVGLAEQVAAHGGDRGHVERDQGDQRDDRPTPAITFSRN